MNGKPINSILKPRFEVIYHEAIKNAEEDFKVNVLDKIKDFTHSYKWSFIISERNKINVLIDENNYPYYSNNFDDKDWLLTQFSSRFFLLNIEEFDDLQEAVYLGSLRDLIHGKIDELKVKIPKYSFNEFADGIQSKYLNSDSTIYNIEEEDYVKILAWRSENIINIVSYELELLVNKHKDYCDIIDEPLVFINSQIQIIEKGLVKSVNNGKDLKSTFSKLFAFKDVDLEVYDDELLLFNYPSFFNDRSTFKDINPVTIKEVLNNLSGKPNELFSNEYVIFYTLDSLLSWLRSIASEGAVRGPHKSSDSLDGLLNKNIDEGLNEALVVKQGINDFVNNPLNSKNQIREFLKLEFEKQIENFNNTENKGPFSLLGEEKRSLLATVFKLNVLFSNNEEEYLQGLKKAIILFEVSYEISGIYNEMFDTISIYPIYGVSSNEIINKLLNRMVLNKSIYIETEGVIIDCMLMDFYYNLPIDFALYNLLQKNISLFEKSRSHLLDVLDNAESNKKILYLQTRLKELKHEELNNTILVERCDCCMDDEDKYLKLFKELLSIEADFIRETAQISPLPFLPAQNKPFFELKEVNSFENFLSKEKQVYILKLLEDLSITLDGKYNLTERKKSALRGIVEALRDCNVLPDIGIDKLCALIAARINLELKSKLNYSDTSKKFNKDAKQYILDYPFH
jgi:hypothetical protein